MILKSWLPMAIIMWIKPGWSRSCWTGKGRLIYSPDPDAGRCKAGNLWAGLWVLKGSHCKGIWQAQQSPFVIGYRGKKGKVLPVTGWTTYSEHFGFSESEVKELLRFYGCEWNMDIVKRWYDGYLFGNTEVYNPWSVLNYTERLYANPQTLPVSCWSNTSSNAIVKDLIQRADLSVKEEIETLIAGGVKQAFKNFRHV